MNAFQCFYTKWGDVLTASGVVLQPSTGVRKLVGGGGVLPAEFATAGGSGLSAAKTGAGFAFIGGSGRNIFIEGLPDIPSGQPSPTGFFRPTVADQFTSGDFLVEVTGPDDASISDGTDVLAILTTGGTAPVGTYDSTPYGEATYNLTVAEPVDGEPFTLDVTSEGGTSVGIPDALVSVSAGTAQAGTFESVAVDEYESAVDADWTVVLDPSGSGELRYLTDVVATRAAGSAHDPSGVYDATALGMANYNLTADEPVDGESWRALVRLAGKTPRVGFAFLEVVLDTGVLDEVNGPFFETSLPPPSGETSYVPLAYSDGYGIEQYVQGAVILP